MKINDNIEFKYLTKFGLTNCSYISSAFLNLASHHLCILVFFQNK